MRSRRWITRVLGLVAVAYITYIYLDIRPNRYLASLEDSIAIGTPKAELEDFFVQQGFEWAYPENGDWLTNDIWLQNGSYSLGGILVREWRDELRSICGNNECEVYYSLKIDVSSFGGGIIRHDYEYFLVLMSGKYKGMLNSSVLWKIWLK